MKLTEFDGQNKNELSMIEVAHAILDQKGEILDFSTLLKEVQDFLNLNSKELTNKTSQFYTDLNIDGSFISLGENRWGLRSWYPIDFIDEEVTQGNEDEAPRRKKRKKASAFVTGEDDIDYNDDDPEDNDEPEEDEEDDTTYGGRVDVDVHGVMVDDEDKEDLGEYKADLSELGTDDEEDELPDGVEGDLTIIEDEDEDDSDEEY
ncbi:MULTISPECIES: DNA-directed RNA polymerase subunit delta [Carnobacterium]|uniref:Probable DNA-directed RNA polymerase subunit delta n=2 Tax=Carnobacterium inhibens TaxID=147709 RepID=U5S6X0_9LACT|nr:MULTISPECIES: DNA-directed RNA polymerase subunit delta [Carnobacterium]AGY80955.1 DNA-directed RNA polymerase subunit delta [Carnobacterium inhibens subsp. gilichinskyi]MBC9826067.1 DNA-directed RNA polymerase subunit delta [Carnobacterium inhibens]MDN5372641.1 DNA-directed polymerase subunit delta [Carnobacterium sp.]